MRIAACNKTMQKVLDGISKKEKKEEDEQKEQAIQAKKDIIKQAK